MTQADIGLFTTGNVFALIETIGGGKWRNVYSCIIYGTALTSRRVFCDEPLFGRLTNNEMRAVRFLVTAGAARTIVEEARQGVALISDRRYEVKYDLSDISAGLVPGSSNDPTWHSPIPQLVQSTFLRRHCGLTASVAGVALTVGSVVDVVDRLPSINVIDLRPLDLEERLEALGALDEIFPTLAKLELIPEGDRLRYTIQDPTLSLQGRKLRINLRSFTHGLLTTTAEFEIGPSSGSLEFAAGAALEFQLVADGVPIISEFVYPVRSVAVAASVLQDPITVISPALKRQTSPVRSAGTIVRVGDPAAAAITSIVRQEAANAWRTHLATKATASEYFFDLRPEIQCRQGGLEALQAIARNGTRSHTSPPNVDVVDPYLLDREAIQAVAELAAAIAPPTLRILTTDNVYCASAVTREADRREFLNAVKWLQGRLGIQIPCYQTSGLHDRYLILGSRVWHIGHSFNRIGCDRSAIVEFKDIEIARRVRRFVDTQCIEANEVKGVNDK